MCYLDNLFPLGFIFMIVDHRLVLRDTLSPTTPNIDHILGRKSCTVKFLNFRMPENFAETTLKFKQKDLSIEKLCPKGVDGMASIVDPDQTAPLGAV